MRTVRNIAIIALLALGITVLPGGGSAAETVLTALTLAFLAAIAFFVHRMWRQNQLTIDSLSDGRRVILYGAMGGIALLIAATDELLATSGGLLVWIALMAGCVLAIIWVIREATSYA